MLRKVPLLGERLLDEYKIFTYIPYSMCSVLACCWCWVGFNCCRVIMVPAVLVVPGCPGCVFSMLLIPRLFPSASCCASLWFFLPFFTCLLLDLLSYV